MTAQTFTPDVGLRLTEAAAQHIQRQLELDPEAVAFRLGLKVSGCSGYMYVVDLARSISDTDLTFESHGVVLVVDRQHLPLLNGTEIDFVKEGLNSAFRFINPNAESECGCGESISIQQPA